MKPPGAGIANENFLKSDRYLGIYKIKTPEELQARVDSYFESCDRHMALVDILPNGEEIYRLDPQPYTWTGLALAVGLSSRQAINKYLDRDQFYDILVEARLKIQNQWESKLQRLGNNNGVMFALSNNRLVDDEPYIQKATVDQNIGGQPGNPVELKTDDLSEEQLKRIEAILSANPDTR